MTALGVVLVAVVALLATAAYLLKMKGIAVRRWAGAGQPPLPPGDERLSDTLGWSQSLVSESRTHGRCQRT